uniref:Uncharacterized protein n=1 Tax=virus sp. ctML55 TaxID=2827627 RepID=A0A8S5RIH5_9VIRU|nr:MAG TPA: hypothetical protein [virus sp. ctML55]
MHHKCTSIMTIAFCSIYYYILNILKLIIVF